MALVGTFIVQIVAAGDVDAARKMAREAGAGSLGCAGAVGPDWRAVSLCADGHVVRARSFVAAAGVVG